MCVVGRSLITRPDELNENQIINDSRSVTASTAHNPLLRGVHRLGPVIPIDCFRRCGARGNAYKQIKFPLGCI